MLDLRSDLIMLCDGLSVVHNGTTVTLSATYYSRAWQRGSNAYTLPCVFVRGVDTPVRNGDIGGGADVYEQHYELSLVCVDSSTIIGETFIEDATSAIQTALRERETALGGAWAVRIDRVNDLLTDQADGTNVYERKLWVRAFGVETY